MKKILSPIRTYIKRRDELMMLLGERRYRDRLVDFVEGKMENGILEVDAAYEQGHPETGSYLSGAVSACNAIIRTVRHGGI